MGRGARPARPGRGRSRLLHAPRHGPAASPTRCGCRDEYVIRVNRRPNQRLRREAYLGPLLPPEVHYPEVDRLRRRARGRLAHRAPPSRRRPRPPVAAHDDRRAPQRHPPVRDAAAQPPRGARAREHLPPIDAAPQLLANRAYGVVEPLLAALDGSGVHALRRPAAASAACREIVRGHPARPRAVRHRPTSSTATCTSRTCCGTVGPSPPCSTSSGPGAGRATSTSTCSCGSAPTRTSTSPRTTRR